MVEKLSTEADTDSDDDAEGPRITMKNMEARSRALDARAAREAELDAEEMRQAELAGEESDGDDLGDVDDVDMDEEGEGGKSEAAKQEGGVKGEDMEHQHSEVMVH